MATVLAPPDQKLELHPVSWETYERLLADLENSSAPRLTYDRGTLEIMSPLAEHERYKHLIELLVDVIAEEWDLDVENLGSTTFKRADLARGFEPDSCFYIRNVERIRGTTRIDLMVDPPPDLVIEIDITHASLDKLSIYAHLGVPEVWRYDGKTLTICTLAGAEYQERDESLALPGIPAAVLSTFLEDGKSLKRPAWLRRVREWARSQPGPGKQDGDH